MAERDRLRAVVDAAREFDAVLTRSGSGVGGKFYDPLLRLRHALDQLDRNEGASRSRPPREADSRHQDGASPLSGSADVSSQLDVSPTEEST